jgi:dihydropyrimidinase
MVHCEDGEMITWLQQAFREQGKTRPAYHALSRPAEAEIRAIEEVIELSAKTGCPVYIVHTSTAKGKETIQSAKKSGVKVYGETCMQYLMLDDSVYDLSLDDRKVLPYIMSPPIRSKADQETLWEGLADGTFDVVASDHCPFNLIGQKDLGIHDFTKIPNGAGGLEHRLVLLYTYGVSTGKITINQFVNLTSTKPAEIFGLGDRKGKIEPGYDADLVIWDPEANGVISVANHYQNCDSEIYEGFQYKGKPEIVFIRGVLQTIR